MIDHAELLREVADEHKVPLRVVGRTVGPNAIAYALSPAGGVKPRAVKGLAESWSLRLGAPVRWVGVHNGYLVVEVPRDEREVVGIDGFMPAHAGDLLIPFGRGIEHNEFRPLSEVAHLLIAGATGQGKSVYINALLTALLRQAGPDELRLVLIDPKRVELAPYADLPHLLAPVARDLRQAQDALDMAVGEMNRRYRAMERAGVKHARDLGLPALVIVVDELADLMLAGSKQIEPLLRRIAAVGRAASVHLVIATQYPKREVITPLLKQNVPTQIAFTVVDHVASQLIIGESGAEVLTGKGDALFKANGSIHAVRVQAPMVSEEQIRETVETWKGRAAPTAPEPEVSDPTETRSDDVDFTALVSQFKPEPEPDRYDSAREEIRLMRKQAKAIRKAYADGADPDLPVRLARIERRLGALEKQYARVENFMTNMERMAATMSTGGE